MLDQEEEKVITEEEFIRVSTYMKQHYGIDLSQKKVIINGRMENYIMLFQIGRAHV